MTKEEALKEARRLLKKSGVDTSEMTDAEVIAKIKATWEEMKPIVEEIIKWMCDEVAPALDIIIASLSKWWKSLPEEVRAELKEG